MAYQLSYWKYAKGPDSPDDLNEVIKPRRLNKVSEIENVIRPIPSECDVITLERTDKQSVISREIWKRKRR
jgi:hypothetical protein